jgi:hypothetical protein
VGTKAKDLLALPERSGKVLAALSDTIYLSTQDGEVFWISLEKSPLHRRCIRVSLLPKVAPGEKYFWRSPGMTFSRGSFIDFRRAREWNPFVSGVRKSISLAGLWACFRRLLGVLDLLEVQEDMGRTISLGRALVESGTLPAFPPTSLMGRVRDMALGLARACLDQDLHSVARMGREMIGLGPGLTPAGDDFLGGLFFAARSLQQGYPEDFPRAEDAVCGLLDWAKTRTHPISYTIFRDLVSGHGPAALHAFFTGLLEEKDARLVLEAAIDLTRIGHSSGWDMLAGALTGLLMVKKSIENGA